jgi:hypothetical protein
LYTDQFWTGNNWKCVNFNDKCYMFQRGHDPLVYNGTSVVKIKSSGTYTGTVQQSNIVLSAYGRIWNADTITDKVTVQWSDTLIGEAYTGGASGSVSIEKILTKGTSPITALAAYNGMLVIFTADAIITYTGADATPSSSLLMQDVINGVGCLSRDSVVDVGTDIFFLSNTGVRSLGRLLTQKSVPIFDVSKNVRDNMMADVKTHGNYDYIRGAYNPIDGWYVLSLPLTSKSYCLDTKQRLDDGSCRITTWNLAPTAMCYRRNQDFIVGVYSGGIGKLKNYSDGGAGYVMSYTTGYLSSQDPNGNSNLTQYSILKQARTMVYGGAGYKVNFEWGVDYNGFSFYGQQAIPATAANTEYNNTAKYGLTYYNQYTTPIVPVKQQLAGAGRVYQFRMTVPINGQPLSIQQIDLFTKDGRVHNV